MDLSFLNRTEYLLDVWTGYVADNPAALALSDERHPRGLSRRKVDELSARVFAWLKEKQIGREDFVFLCLPRGAVALIAILGVWKAGAAFTLVEDNYPPERITFIRKDCGCKAVIDRNAWLEILKTEFVNIIFLDENSIPVSRMMLYQPEFNGISGLEFSYDKVDRQSDTFEVTFTFNNINFDFIPQI